MKPYFSIVLPTYNRAALLSRAIESVLAQTVPTWELIIVDDGSTDNTKSTVKAFNDQRIHYIYQENQERSAARNRGIKEASSDWVCFLDSDDEYPTKRLEELHNEIQTEKKTALYFTDIEFKHNSDLVRYSYASDCNMQQLEFLLLNVIGTPQVCVSRSILDEFVFNPSITIGEDLELWIRIQSKFEIIYLNNVSPIIAHDHIDRSVNYRESNSGIKRLETLNKIFSNNHHGNTAPKSLKRKIYSDTYFSIAKHYMFTNRKIPAMYWLLRSIFKDVSNVQRKHRLFCLISLLRGNIPVEYQ